jgi:ribosomal protein S15P/S13E
METQALDKMYLEWSQFTKARNAREVKAAVLANRVVELLESVQAHPEDPQSRIEEAKQRAKHIYDGLKF